MPTFDWHTVVISGGRDLVTPPTVADRIAELIPSSALVRLATAGHSVLDTRERAALHIAREVCAGRTETLAGQGRPWTACRPARRCGLRVRHWTPLPASRRPCRSSQAALLHETDCAVIQSPNSPAGPKLASVLRTATFPATESAAG